MSEFDEASFADVALDDMIVGAAEGATQTDTLQLAEGYYAYYCGRFSKRILVEPGSKFRYEAREVPQTAEITP